MLEAKQCPSPDSGEAFPERFSPSNQSPASMLEAKQCPSPESGKPFRSASPQASNPLPAASDDGHVHYYDSAGDDNDVDVDGEDEDADNTTMAMTTSTRTQHHCQ